MKLRDELTETSAKYLKEQDTSASKNDYKVPFKNRKNIFLWTICATIVFLAIFAAIFIFFVNNNATQKSELKQDNLLIQENIENKESIIVPNLIGKSFDDLQKNTNSDDYNIFLSEKVYDDKVDEGKVISQTPQPETYVEKGSNIIVSISKGPKFKVLPSIDGLSLSDASSILSKQGFIPIQETLYSDVVEQGKIVGYKNHSKSDKVEVGSQVTIIVSKGKK